MRKLIYILILLSCIMVSAQDGYNQSLVRYNEVNKTFNNLDSTNVKYLSDKIINNIEVDYGYVKTIVKNNGITLIYVLNEGELERETRLNYKNNLIFKYSLGYDLLLIQGNFDDLYLIWVSNFISGPSKSLVLNNYRYRDFIYKPLNINYRFTNKNDIWVIRKIR